MTAAATILRERRALPSGMSFVLRIVLLATLAPLVSLIWNCLLIEGRSS